MSNPEAENWRAETWRILHIDDDEDDHIIVRTMLRAAQGRGMALEWAATFQEGRQKLADTHYQAVLVDYDLGAQTGIELIREFVERGYSAPMILLTGRGSYEVDVEAMHAGATLYLTKNEINPLLLERAIRYAVEIKQSQEDLRQARDKAKRGEALLHDRNEALRRSEEKFARTFQYNPAATAITRLADGVYTDANQAFCQVAAYSRDEIVGRTAVGLGFFSPQVAGELLDEFQEKGHVYQQERTLTTKNGAQRHMLVSLEPIDASGEASILAIMIDITDRKQAQEWLRVTLASIADAVITTDRQGRVTYLNHSAEAITGWSAAEAAGQLLVHVFHILNEETGQPVEDPVAKVLRSGQVVGLANHAALVARSGRVVPVEDSAAPIRDNDGQVLGVVLVFRDVTEKRQAEDALRQSEEKFRFIAANIPDTIFIQDLDLRYIWILNPADPVDESQVVGKTDADLLPPEEAQRLIEIKRQVVETGQDVKVELQLSPGGVTRWYEAVYQPVRDAGGQITGVLSYSGDITNRKQAGDALRESEARFRSIANNISQLAWMADAAGSIFWYNQRWFDYTGTTLEEVQGRGWQKVHHPEHVERVVEKLSRCLESGEFWEDTFPLRGKDGQYRWFLSRAVPILDEQGQVLHWFGTNTDVTEHMQLQEENRQQKDLLERVLQTVPAGIALLQGPQHVYRLVNDEYRRYARGKGDLIGRTVAEVWPDISPVVIPQLDRVYQSGEPVAITDAPLQIDRSGAAGIEYYSYTFSPLYRGDGSIEGVMILAVDTTEAVRIRQAVAAQSARLEAVLQALPVGVWITDEQGWVLATNPTASAIWAGDAPHLPDVQAYSQLKSWNSATGQPVLPEDQPLAQVLRTRKPVTNFETDIERLDGSRGTILSAAAPVTTPEGRFIGAVSLAQDITDRRYMEEALRASEERYRLAAHASNDAIRDWHLATDAVQWNEALTELFGYEPAAQHASSGDWWKAQIHPDDRAAVVESLNDAISGRSEVWTADYRFRRAGGSYADVHDRGWVVRDQNGQPLRMVGAMRDITAQKEAEATLRESETRFRQLADSMPQLVWTAQPGGRVDYYNQRHLLYGGIQPSEGGSWEWGPVLHPDDLQPTEAAWQEAVQTGGTYEVEHRVRMAGGEYRWHLSRGIPVYDEQGQLVKWFGTATDIHDFMQVQEALRQREQRLRRLFEANLIGIVSRNASGKILEANDAYLEMIGYARAEIEAEGITVQELTPSEYHALDTQKSEEVLANGICRPYEKEYQRRDGRRVPILVGYSLFEGEQAEFIGFVLDLSELKQAQAELAEYADRLKRSNRDLEDFAFVASHDLQEPLRKIHQFGRNLHQTLEGQLTEEAADSLSRMQNAAERMQGMIEGLLNLSRISTRARDFGPVNLNQAAEDVISDLEMQIAASRGQVVVENLPELEGDPLQMRQLLQNLIANALKFSKDKQPPLVRVSGRLVGNQGERLAEIVVEDNGVGFETQDAERLFQPFVRLHGRSRFDGTGMGLAICKKIAERHGGSISASGQPGQGSRFTVTLPVEHG